MIISRMLNDVSDKLVSASHTRIGATDRYSVTVFTTGLNDAGDTVTIRMVISRDELAMIAQAAMTQA